MADSSQNLTSSSKKSKRINAKRMQQRTRVILLNQHERWLELKRKLGIQTDSQMAKMLIDRYFETELHVGPMTSPAVKGFRTLQAELSVISSMGPDSEQTMSGIESIQDSDSEPKKQPALPTTITTSTRSGCVVYQKQISSSFIDPLNLTLDVSDVIDSDAASDSDYEPSFLQLEQQIYGADEHILDIAYEEMAFGLETDSENTVDTESECSDYEKQTATGVLRITTDADIHKLVDQHVCLAFVEQVKSLASTNVQTCTHHGCGTSLSIVENFVGSALYLKWICDNGHVAHTWCSQPLLNRGLHSGDFLSAAAILTSGNNFGKISLWCQMLNMKFLSASTFHQIQSTYMVSAVDAYWNQQQQLIREEFRGKDIVVLGDARNDSPGHCAQYASYTLMEESTKKILSLRTLDKRETGRKSGAMEKAGFIAALEELKNNGMKISEVVTDGHTGISYLMSNYIE